MSVSKEPSAGQTGYAKRSPNRFNDLNKLIIASVLFNDILKTYGVLLIKHFCKLPVLPFDSPERTNGSGIKVLSSLAKKKPVYSRDICRGQCSDDDCLEGKSGSCQGIECVFTYCLYIFTCQGVEPDVGLHLLLDPPHQDVHAAVHPDRLWQLPQESRLQGF